MKKEKIRLDKLLVNRGLAANRSKAQALAMAGCVFQGEQRLNKPGQLMPVKVEITLRGQIHRWASRGGLKLEYGLNHFGLIIQGLTALDIGSSTGGFTDVLLVNGASRVYAVDVGYGQLLPRLRYDPRVVILERTNARYLTAMQVPEPIDLVVCDVSFIGLRVVLPASLSLTHHGTQLLALIKPQFEVSKDQIGKKGVVYDYSLQVEACVRITSWLASMPGWHVLGVIESPIVGAEGNREFLVYAIRKEE